MVLRSFFVSISKGVPDVRNAFFFGFNSIEQNRYIVAVKYANHFINTEQAPVESPSLKTIIHIDLREKS